MPYIKSIDYGRATRTPVTPGELNYAITLGIIMFLEGGSLATFHLRTLDLCKSYINRRGLSYTIGNEVVGVLSCAGLEAERRCGPSFAVNLITTVLTSVGKHTYDFSLAPYEDGKIKENGDVYPQALVG